MKKSKLQRKYVNQMRDMGDVPWPERRFKYPATLSVVGAAKETHLGSCKRPVAETKVRSGKLRRKKVVEIACGGRVFLKRGSLGKRRVYCESCRGRKRQRLQELRLKRRLEQRFGISLRQEAREERRSMRMLNKFRRTGVR